MAADMTGKNVLITGGARGMGRETARMLATLGAHIIIVDWEGESGTRLRDEINELGLGSAEFQYCDISDLAAVREFAAQVLAEYQCLDVLLCNAGITDPVYRRTPQGFEHHVATCHLAHFLLVHLLRDLLVESAPARIIMISSEAHKAGDGLDFEDLNNAKLWPEPGRASNNAAFAAYHRAKLSNLYFMYEMAERLAGTGVTINAISPGFFVNTSIYRNLTGVFMWGAKLVFGAGSLFGLNTPQRSARTYVWVATDAGLANTTATYFQHLQEIETSTLARELEPRKKLWAWSAEQTGVDGFATGV
jgi:NAD(P)-dependent dehydrogenase (short-subunit alcohol dehydrogenase family)